MPDRPARLRPLAARRAPARAARPGAAGAVGLRAARAGGDRAVHLDHRHPGAPGLRPDRGRRPVVTSTLCSQANQPGSVGAALPGIELRLVDETYHVVEGEDPGEIQVRGANLFSGYWPDGADGPDADGWYGTGDVGFLDADGDLFLVDRVKELVIVSGFNVYPTEVEDVHPRGRRASPTPPSSASPTTRPARPCGVRRRRRRPSRPHLEEAVRAHAVVRLARFKQPDAASRSSTSSAHRHRQGPEGPAARDRATPDRRAPRMSPRDAARHPLLPARLPPLRRRPRGRRRRVCDDLGEPFDEVDIDDRRRPRGPLRRRVPVTFVDGRQHDFWRVDEARLRAALAAR